MSKMFEIVMEAGPDGCLDPVEDALRTAGHTDIADALLKIQQDAGLEMDPSFMPGSDAVAPGVETAKLWKAFEPVSDERVRRVFSAAYNAIDGALQQRLKGFMDEDLNLTIDGSMDATTQPAPDPKP